MKSSFILLFFYYFFYSNVGIFALSRNPRSPETCKLPEQKCVILPDCAPLYSLLQQKPMTPENIKHLRESQCGFEGKHPKVCCAVKSHENLGEVKSNLLPDTSVCGESPENRIVGGELAALNEYPWMALLEYDKPSGRGFHCGGSLINNRYVLTAAHCIKKVPRAWKLVSVRLGEYDLDTPEDCDGDTPGLENCADKPLDIEVEEKIVHEQYDPTSISQPNDIALLRLSKEVPFSEYVKPICIPTTGNLRNNRYAGATMSVAGWGRTENSSQSSIKLKLEVPVKSDDECLSWYSKNANVRLSNNQLCAGGVKGKDSCTGDSGGPLMYRYKSGKEDNWYIYGVVSFGPTACGLKDWPGVYTRVPEYSQWIVDNLKP